MSLEVTGLCFGYHAMPLFSSLTASPFKRGEVTALIGRNGVGKSTLFQLLSGLLPPKEGTITLDGVNLAELSQRRRAERIFLLTQHTATRAALCVFDVIMLARRGWRSGRVTSDDIAKVESVLDSLGIEHLADRLVPELSGGQQQLVAISQALVRDPDVLLLDEPTSALDLRRQLEVMHLVQDVTRQRNIVTIAALHDLNLASRFADRFLLIQDGAVKADGSPEAVLELGQTASAYGVGLTIERGSRGQLLVHPYLER
ncbi:ABC transporter ATP-binding protein [Tianweitania sp.]|uniref:ABC transporter ATP-binding protein n=1 Tax=Tianweitania sp. TaxID=2021634 RepID=UPI002896B56F|nr:ABC transporter ATP-binding protein [Tianweitania sp.]